MHPLRSLAIFFIRLYQRTLSPDHGWFKNSAQPTCRYRPTCSDYMIEAIQIHGIMAGSWLGLNRIFRCHPWRAGGYDPVPTTKERK